MSTRRSDGPSQKRGRQGEHRGPFCGAKTRSKDKDGRPCKRPAGWGTNHLGYGPCKLHLGSTRQHVRAAALAQAQHEMREAMPAMVLVRQIDKDVMRTVTLRVLDGLGLDLDQIALSRELLERELAALAVPVTRKEARRFLATNPTDPQEDG